MKPQQLKSLKSRMARAGFQEWQIAAVRKWAESFTDRRKARSSARRVFGV